MNPITVVCLFNKADFLKSRNVLLELYSKSRKKTLIIVLFIAIVILTPAIFSHIYTLKWSSQLFILAGILLLIDGFLFLEKRRQRAQYINQTAQVTEIYAENDIFLKYEISDSILKISDDTKSINLRWKYFSGYTVYLTYLILIPKLGSYLEAIVLENNLPNFARIEEIVSSNLKKISTP